MRHSKKLSAILWTLQGLLAALFVFAGAMKLITPIEVMAEQMTIPLPGLFLQFIGVCEVAGGIGLVLPWLTRIQRGLTPLAAACLVIIMIGATSLTMATGPVAGAIFPAVVGILCAFVAYARSQQLPRRRPAYRVALQPINS
jgi:uncharacterized membrane protein YphA (DoxX/SURF4 family)